MDQLARLTLGGYQVVAAPSDEMVTGQPEELEAYRIVVLKAAEEPAVDAFLAQDLLDFGNSVG